MAKVAKNQTVEHDGKVYREGDNITGLSDEQEQALVAAGAVEAPAAKPTGGGSTATNK